MKIEKLTIDQFGPLENLKIKFSSPKVPYFNKLNINIIVGENGVGKTSLLKLISLILTDKNKLRNCNYTFNFSNDNETIKIDSDNKTNNFNPSCVIVSSYSVNESFNVLDNSRIKVPYYYCGPAEIVDKDLNTVQITSINRRILHRILLSFYGKEKYNSIKMNAIKYLMNFIKFNGLPTIELNELPPHIDENDNIKDDIRIILKDIYGIKNKKNLIHPNKINHSLLAAIIRIDRKYKIIKDLKFIKNTKPIRLSNMSSGELTMFNRFFPLITLMKENAIVLIDEPETHLHPRWIREYIYSLYKMFGEYNAHIILASHSPMIVSDVPKECIVGLYKKEDFKVEQYNIEDNTFGAGQNDILEDVFHLTNYKGKFASEIDKRLREQLLNKEYTSDEFMKALLMFHDLSPTLEKYQLMAQLNRL